MQFGDSKNQIDRRSWMTLGAAAAAASASLVRFNRRAGAQDPLITINAELKEKGQPLDAARVREFVISAHRDLTPVREMLREEPALVNATIDWGGGDFEDALGGASHMGRRDIAEYLIERGARPNLFTFAMLGHVEPVRAALDAMPQQVHVPGPHGIPLLAHAERGGEQAKQVAELIRAKMAG